MLNILYIASGSEIGGGEKNLYDIASRASEKFKISAVVPAKGNLSSKLEKIDCKVYLCDLKLANLYRLLKIIKIQKPDLIHIHGLRASLIGRIVSRSSHIPCVYTMHGIHYLYYTNPIKKWLYLAGDKILKRWTNGFICVSKSVFDQSINIIKVDKTRTWLIYNGIDAKGFSQTLIKNQKNTNQDDKPILCIGRLQRPKGQIYLLKAISIINKTFKKVPFIFIGEGEDRAQLEAFAANNELDNVKFLGSTGDISKFLLQSKLLVVPSLWEGFPYIVLEAMASGLPVIATRVGGIPEMITDGKTGLLVPAQDEKALAQTIIKTMNDSKLLEQIREAGSKRVVENFSSENMLNQTFKVYEQILK